MEALNVINPLELNIPMPSMHSGTVANVDFNQLFNAQLGDLSKLEPAAVPADASAFAPGATLPTVESGGSTLPLSGKLLPLSASAGPADTAAASLASPPLVLARSTLLASPEAAMASPATANSAPAHRHTAEASPLAERATRWLAGMAPEAGQPMLQKNAVLQGNAGLASEVLAKREPQPLRHSAALQLAERPSIAVSSSTVDVPGRVAETVRAGASVVSALPVESRKLLGASAPGTVNSRDLALLQADTDRVPVHALTSPAGVSAASTSAFNPITGAAQILSTRDPGWSEVLGQRVQMMINQASESAEIQLHPAELGRMRIRIDMAGDGAKIEFSVANPRTQELMESLLPRLQASLEASGVRTNELSLESGDDEALMAGRDEASDHQSSQQPLSPEDPAVTVEDSDPLRSEIQLQGHSSAIPGFDGYA